MVLRKSDVTFHSDRVRFFPAAQIQALTCTEATEAIAVVSDNFECMKPRGRKNMLRLTYSLAIPKPHPLQVSIPPLFGSQTIDFWETLHT